MGSEVLLSRIASEPVLLEPKGASLFAACINSAFKETGDEAHALFSGNMSAATDFEEFWHGDMAHWRPYQVSDEGILSIQVVGSLVNKFPYQLGSWVTGYEYIEAALLRGLGDSEVKGIALVIDSPGGTAAGNFELVDLIYEARKEKPIRAFVYDSAYSAAYSIASAAEHVTTTRSGSVGSIGVVAMHTSYEKSLDSRGIEVTFIYAGKHKVEGNMYEGLSEEAKGRIQKRIDKTYGIFVGTVARNRGIPESVVRDTEALTYDAEDAMRVGLIDSVGTFAEEVTRFSDELTEGFSMSKSETKEQLTVPMDDHNTAVSAAHAEGAKEGMLSERSRVQSILALDEGAKRGKAAMSVAMQTSMGVDEAKTFLASLPEESVEVAAKATTNQFEAAMAKGNPEVGSGEGDEQSNELSASDRMKGAYSKAQGIQVK